MIVGTLKESIEGLKKLMNTVKEAIENENFEAVGASIPEFYGRIDTFRKGGILEENVAKEFLAMLKIIERTAKKRDIARCKNLFQMLSGKIEAEFKKHHLV